MCYRKPGPRCSTVAKQRLERAERRLQEAGGQLRQSLERGDSTEINDARLVERDCFRQKTRAQLEYDLTSDGIAERRSKGEEALADRYQATRDRLLHSVGSAPSDAHHDSDADADTDRCPECGRFVASSGSCDCAQGEAVGNAIQAAMDPDVARAEYDSGAEKVKALQAEIEKGVEQLVTSENWQTYLDTQAKFHNYSFQNTLLIMMQRPDAERVAGFHTWKAVDRSVNKGEKGIFILRPMLKDVPLEDRNGNPVIDENGKRKKGKRLIGFGGTYVFDVKQTSGKDLPRVVHQLDGAAPAGMREDAEQAIRDMGYTLEYSDVPMSANGYTDFENKKIVIAGDRPDLQQCKTLFHEIGHARMHNDPELRGKYHSGPGGCRGQWEIEAESFAYVAMRAQGVDNVGDYSFGYAAGWGKGDTKEIRKTAERVQKESRGFFETVKLRNLNLAVSELPEAKAAAKEAASRPRKKTTKKRTSRARKAA